MLPVLIRRRLPRLSPQDERIHEIGILRDHDPIFGGGKHEDRRVGGAVRVGEIEGVDGIVAGRGEPRRETAGELRVDDELHAASGSTRFTRVRRAAYSSAARMSSCSRSGYSARISSSHIPELSRSRISSTG